MSIERPTCPDDCIERPCEMFDAPAIGFFRDEDGHCVGYRRPEDEDERRALALATYLECDFDEVSKAPHGDDTFEAPGRAEWLVVTDERADELWDASLDAYLDECVLEEMADSVARYFDRDRWKADARADGRGHSLASYDSNEEDSQGYCLFRTN